MTDLVGDAFKCTTCNIDRGSSKQKFIQCSLKSAFEFSIGIVGDGNGAIGRWANCPSYCTCGIQHAHIIKVQGVSAFRSGVENKRQGAVTRGYARKGVNTVFFTQFNGRSVKIRTVNAGRQFRC